MNALRKNLKSTKIKIRLAKRRSGVKTVAKIFCIILLPYYIFIFYESLIYREVWFYAGTWFNWVANIVGILGLSIYAFSLKGPPPLFWRVGLLIIGLVYGNQIIRSFFSMKFNELGDIAAAVNYFFMVGPCVLAVIYLSLSSRKVQGNKE